MAPLYLRPFSIYFISEIYCTSLQSELGISDFLIAIYAFNILLKTVYKIIVS